MAIQIYYGSYFSWITECLPWRTQEELQDFWSYDGRDGGCPVELLRLQEFRGVSIALIVPGTDIEVDPGKPLEVQSYLDKETPNPRQLSDYITFMRRELTRYELPQWMASAT